MEGTAVKTVFRKAVPADAPAIGHLITAAWQTAYRGILSDAMLNTLDEQKKSERFQDSIQNKPEFRHFVLETGRRIAGVSVVCPCLDEGLAGAADIMVFYIHPDMQGQGLGRVMMEHTLADIRRSGEPQIVLWVFRDNRNARAFYERMGFTFDGAEKAMPYHENAVAVRYRYVGESAKL
jgi:ribosomal protein S18 acetylase RimI-like enzyme